jgi:hypothetical protein
MKQTEFEKPGIHEELQRLQNPQNDETFTWSDVFGLATVVACAGTAYLAIKVWTHAIFGTTYVLIQAHVHVCAHVLCVAMANQDSLSQQAVQAVRVMLRLV